MVNGEQHQVFNLLLRLISHFFQWKSIPCDACPKNSSIYGKAFHQIRYIYKSKSQPKRTRCQRSLSTSPGPLIGGEEKLEKHLGRVDSPGVRLAICVSGWSVCLTCMTRSTKTQAQDNPLKHDTIQGTRLQLFHPNRDIPK